MNQHGQNCFAVFNIKVAGFMYSAFLKMFYAQLYS